MLLKRERSTTISCMRLKTEERKFFESHNMKIHDKTPFRRVMQQIDWEFLLDHLKTILVVCWPCFCISLEYPSLPTQSRASSEYALWFSASHRSLMKERDKAKQVAEGQQELWPTHRQLLNRVTK